MSWFDSSCFFHIDHWKNERQARRQTKAFLAFRDDCLVQFHAAIHDLDDAIDVLVQEAGPIGLDDAFFSDAKLAPLFAIGEVLSAQGTIYPQQEDRLKTLLLNRESKYNHAQLIEAAISRTGVYTQLCELVGLQRETCGTLWLTLFELVYRTRNTELYQQIVEHLHSIVVCFYNLGKPDALRPSLICDRIKDHMDLHMNSYQQTPHIHALMLLQSKLLRKRKLEIKEHYLVNEDSIVLNNRRFYVFSVYQKDANTFCGKFAVRKLHAQNGDLILEWNSTSNAFEEFYRELV